MINEIYHFTSIHAWENICKEGILKPKSNPSLKETTSRNARSHISNKQYLVGIPTDALNVWQEYELIEAVKQHATKNIYGFPTKEEYLLLKVPILNHKKALIREHKYPTRKWGDQFMPGAFDEVDYMMKSSGMSMATKEQVNFVNEMKIKYLNSTIKLQDYKNNFEVPEIWLHQYTPVNEIEIVKNIESIINKAIA